MGLFNFKRKEAEQIENELNVEPVAVSIPKEKFTLETRVEKSELPIFEVYSQLKEDWETKGYSDAKAFPETSYKERVPGRTRSRQTESAGRTARFPPRSAGRFQTFQEIRPARSPRR